MFPVQQIIVLQTPRMCGRFAPRSLHTSQKLMRPSFFIWGMGKVIIQNPNSRGYVLLLGAIRMQGLVRSCLRPCLGQQRYPTLPGSWVLSVLTTSVEGKSICNVIGRYIWAPDSSETAGSCTLWFASLIFAISEYSYIYIYIYNQLHRSNTQIFQPQSRGKQPMSACNYMYKNEPSDCPKDDVSFYVGSSTDLLHQGHRTSGIFKYNQRPPSRRSQSPE